MTFVAPTNGPTTHMMDSTTVTDDDGRARVIAVAGEMAGTYAVTANVPGAPATTPVLANTELPTGNPRATDIADMAMNEITAP
ncbi:hypothetical protein D3C83_171670 [compost metagenome]